MSDRSASRSRYAGNRSFVSPDWENDLYSHLVGTGSRLTLFARCAEAGARVATGRRMPGACPAAVGRFASLICLVKPSPYMCFIIQAASPQLARCTAISAAATAPCGPAVPSALLRLWPAHKLASRLLLKLLHAARCGCSCCCFSCSAFCCSSLP